MIRTIVALPFLLAILTTAAPVAAQQDADALFQYQDSRARWASPENFDAAKGQGAIENEGQKGHAFDGIPAGGVLVLAHAKGAGVVDRIWMTFADRSPEMLRSLRIEMFWDGAEKPAVSVPVGDFFLHGAGEMVRMDTALFSSPEARSFVATIPMPYRNGMRIQIVNDSDRDLSPIYFDVNFRSMDALPQDALYFHGYWSRDPETTPGKAFKILPRVSGKGRFLGTVVTTFANPIYEDTWWGEGEVKIFLDGDGKFPSLAGTGTEDYIGTAWGQGAYINRFQGAPVADPGTGRWSYYRFHIPDPIFFARDVSVEIQQIGGAPKPRIQELIDKGVPITPISVDAGSRALFRKLLESGVSINEVDLDSGHTNYLRSDDVSAVAYFYLDRPVSDLPTIQPLAQRTQALRPPPPPNAIKAGALDGGEPDQ